MTYIGKLIDQGDYCPLIVVIAILYLVGSKMAQNQPRFYHWGPRIAVGVFVVFAFLKVTELETPTARGLLWAVVGALLAAGLVLGPAWIVLAIGGFAHGYMSQADERSRRRTEQRKAERERKKREEGRRRQQAEHDGSAAERELALREAEERRVAEERVEAEGAQRREDGRLACELLYNLRAADISERFNREQFKYFLATYMDDSKPVDVVENRARELQRLIEQHYETSNPPERFRDLAELTQWYQKQKGEIEGLSLPAEYKEDILIQLNERYSELTERIMEKL